MDSINILHSIYTELLHSGFPDKQRLLHHDKALGRGNEGIVFRLGERYALKMPHCYADEDLSKLELQYIEDDFPGEEVGQIRCMLGNKIPIMHQLKGFTGSFSYARAPRYNGTNDIHLTKDFYPIALRDYTEYLIVLASFPIQSYENFARMITVIDQKKCFDPCPNNLIIDPKERRLTLIDLLSKEHAAQYNLFAKREENSLAYMIGMLIDAMFLQMEFNQITHPSRRQARNTPRLIALRKQILKNSLIAAYKYHLKVPAYPFDQQHAFSMCDPENLFAVSGMDRKWPAIRKLLFLPAYSNDEKGSIIETLLSHFV